MEEEIEELMGFFSYKHLPEHLQTISLQFNRLAHSLNNGLTTSRQKVRMLERLLEAKDCAVRAGLKES